MAAVERRGARGSNRGTRLSFAIWPRKSLDSSSRVNFTCSGPQARSVLAPRPSTCTPRTPSPAPPRGAAATVYMVHARSSQRGVGGWGKGPFEPGGGTAVSCFSRKGFAVMGHRTVVSGFLSVVRAWRGGGGRVRRGGPQVLAGGRAAVDVHKMVPAVFGLPTREQVDRMALHEARVFVNKFNFAATAPAARPPPDRGWKRGASTATSSYCRRCRRTSWSSFPRKHTSH